MVQQGAIRSYICTLQSTLPTNALLDESFVSLLPWNKVGCMKVQVVKRGLSTRCVSGTALVCLVCAARAVPGD